MAATFLLLAGCAESVGIDEAKTSVQAEPSEEPVDQQGAGGYQGGTAAPVDSNGPAGASGWPASTARAGSAGQAGDAGSAGQAGAGGAGGKGAAAGSTAQAGAGGAAGQGGFAGAAGQAGGSQSGVSCTPKERSCSTDQNHIIECNSTGTHWNSVETCPSGTTCENAACVGPIAWHLARSVDGQFVQEQSPTQLKHCTTVSQDLTEGRLLCDFFHAVDTLKPRFGLFLASSWLVFRHKANDPCAASPDAQRACIGNNLRQTIDALHRHSPSMMASAHLAEYVHQNNVPPNQWPDICIPWTIQHKWSDKECVPDITHSAAARQYVERWAETFVDAGVRALIFGQARLMAGQQNDSSAVSPEGAKAIAEIVRHIRNYAAQHGVPRIYIGLQASSSALVGGKEVADFVTGAMHLEPVSDHLFLPLSRKAPVFGSQYDQRDWHDANLLNNANGLPVLLDYDNYSNAPTVPDDIRRLAQVKDNATRAQTLRNHFYMVHTYNPRAFLSIPVSKHLGNDTGTTCQGINKFHFSANGCGLTSEALSLFTAPEATPTVPNGTQHPPIERDFFGIELSSPDVLISYAYRVLLSRTPSESEYRSALAMLPDTPISAEQRESFVVHMVESAAFQAAGMSDQLFIQALYRLILLREPDPAGASYWLSQLKSSTRSVIVHRLLQTQEAKALYLAP